MTCMLRSKGVWAAGPCKMKVYKAICELYLSKGFPPTSREVASLLEVSQNWVNQTAIDLRQAGLLEDNETSQWHRRMLPTRLTWVIEPTV